MCELKQLYFSRVVNAHFVCIFWTTLNKLQKGSTTGAKDTRTERSVNMGTNEEVRLGNNLAEQVERDVSRRVRAVDECERRVPMRDLY